jgi:hypothetical protein
MSTVLVMLQLPGRFTRHEESEFPCDDLVALTRDTGMTIAFISPSPQEEVTAVFATLNGPLVTDYVPIQQSPWMLLIVAFCLLVGAIGHGLVAIAAAVIGLAVLLYWVLHR